MKVYWYGISEYHVISGLNFSEPSPSIERVKYYSPKERANNFAMCPSIKDAFHNVFDLSFPFDYKLSGFDKFPQIHTNDYTQDFFEKMVWIRNVEKKLMNLNIHYFFITEEDSCMIELMPPALVDNDYAKKTMTLGGKFDVARWPRPLNNSFVVKENVSEIKIQTGDVYSQIRFPVNEKIEFVKYRPTDELLDIMKDYMKIQAFKHNFWNLNQYYDVFKKIKVKKYMIKKIKENVL